MSTNGKKSWRLTPEQLIVRREQLGRELDQVELRRDQLRSAQIRAGELKEIIKATPEGEELEALKTSVKDLGQVLECLHKNVERLSREILTGETEDPQDSLPGVEVAKKPKVPLQSAAERTLSLLQEGESVRITVMTDEQIEAEEKARAVHNLRESWRTMLLGIIEQGGASMAKILEAVAETCETADFSSPSELELDEILAAMVKSGAVVVDSLGWYMRPDASLTETSIKDAVLRVLQVEKGWCPQNVLVTLTQEEFPIGACPSERQILDGISALKKAGQIEGDGDLEAPCWKATSETRPSKKPSKRPVRGRKAA